MILSLLVALLLLALPHKLSATCCATLQLLVSSPVTTTAIVTVINSVVSRSPQRLYKVSVFFNSEYPSVSLPTTKMTANFVRLSESNGWECTSVDSELFIAQFELNHPFPTKTGVQVTPNIQSFGENCPIMPNCPSSLAALTAGAESANSSEGLVDLGPFGKRPVWLAIVLAVITALVILATLYAMWRRAYPNNPVPTSVEPKQFTNMRQEKRSDPFIPLKETPSVEEWTKPYSPATTVSSVGAGGAVTAGGGGVRGGAGGKETRIQIYDGDDDDEYSHQPPPLRHSKSAKSLKAASSAQDVESATLVMRSKSMHTAKAASNVRNKPSTEVAPPLPLLPQFTNDSSDDLSEASRPSRATTTKSVRGERSYRGGGGGGREGHLRRNKSSHSLAASSSSQLNKQQQQPLIKLKKQKSLVELQEKSIIPQSAKVILKKQQSMRARTRPSSPTGDEEAEYAFTQLVGRKSLKYDLKKRRSKSIDISYQELSGQRTDSSPDTSLAEIFHAAKIGKRSANGSIEVAPEMELGEYTPPPEEEDDDDWEDVDRRRRAKSPPLIEKKGQLWKSKSHQSMKKKNTSTQ